MPVTVLAKTPATAADLLELIDRLGGIDPARVRLNPPPGQATERDLLHLLDGNEKTLCELIDGTLVEKPMGFEEDLLGTQLIQVLGPFVKAHRLGVVLGAQAPFRVIRRDVRLPDVAFISTENWRTWKRSRPSVAGFAPDLAIEILSKSNTRAEMARKRRAYFAGGTRAVWEINPRRRTVTVYTNPISSDRLIETDTLDGGDVLPGFKLRLSELFTDPLG